jgi:hypothetical protein
MPDARRDSEVGAVARRAVAIGFGLLVTEDPDVRYWPCDRNPGPDAETGLAGGATDFDLIEKQLAKIEAKLKNRA